MGVVAAFAWMLGYVKGRLAPCERWSDWITATATAVLTLFALVQLLREKTRERVQREDRLAEVAGPARLLCRSLEEQIAAFPEDANPSDDLVKKWARRIILDKDKQDVLERQFVTTLHLGLLAGEGHSHTAKQAFSAWLEAIDRMNMINDVTSVKRRPEWAGIGDPALAEAAHAKLKEALRHVSTFTQA